MMKWAMFIAAMVFGVLGVIMYAVGSPAAAGWCIGLTSIMLVGLGLTAMWQAFEGDL